MRDFAKELNVPVGLVLPAVTELAAPFFNDVTLRDGNQALRRPWSPEEKEIIFGFLTRLRVQAVEVGYPGASEMDFQCVSGLASIAPKGMVIGALARTHEVDIVAAIKALQYVKEATPMLHTFIGMSPFHMENVLKKPPAEIRRMAVEAVRMAREGIGRRGHIEFSPEHFGDCVENLDWVIDCFLEIVEAGADVINLPNTVERYRPGVFVAMVGRVRRALPKAVWVSVHCHNDLGMGTATTVESYFAGAQQLEVTLNGLGERAGNTSIFQVATSLHCCGVEVDINFDQIYETAIQVAEMAHVPIHEKDPLIGSDVLMQRSGIHQHGAIQTFGRAKGAYRSVDLEFTSQSGYTAVHKIVMDAGHPITKDEARLLQPALKLVSEDRGALGPEELVVAYLAFKGLQKTEIVQEDVNAVVRDAIGLRGKLTWVCRLAYAVAGTDVPTATVVLINDGRELPPQAATGDGPVDAVYKAIGQSTGLEVLVEDYQIRNVTSGADAQAQIVCVLSMDKRRCAGEGVHTDTVTASVKAYMQALNRLVRGETNGVV